MREQTITMSSELKARVLNIQRMSTEDGPGIRTTIFFKGCGLGCLWCHNPESISPRPQVQWIENKCIGCKNCIAVCPLHALSAGPEGILIDRIICDGCGRCAEECPSTAMELLGKTWGIQELLDEAEKDRAYFENSGGGITVSGGDPTIQARFVAEFLKGCKERGLHTALDTCGLCPESSLDLLLPYTDLVLYDIKTMDPALHEKFTGHQNERILKNAVYIRDYIKSHDSPSEFWVRTPLIPDATSGEENIRAIGRFIADSLGNSVSRWELCSFNNLCRDKYRRLGIDWQFRNTKLMSRELLDRIASIAKESGVNPDIVHWTGATRVDERKDETTDTDSKSHLRLVKGCTTC